MSTADDAARARAHFDAGQASRVRGDRAAAITSFAEAMRLLPTWRDPLAALRDLGAGERACEVALGALAPGMRAPPRGAGGKLGIFTVASNNYAAHARAFLESAAIHYPGAALFLIVVDRDLLEPASYPDGCHVVKASEIGIPDFAAMAMRYNVVELNTAVKPFAFLHLMLWEHVDRVLYFDPDILVFGRSDEILARLDDGASMVLTPHMSAPPKVRCEPNDRTFLRAGTYNLGFLAARRCDETVRLLRWWAAHLQFKCCDRQSDGLFVDQRFMDLVPGYGRNVAIHRGNGANVAYWNLADRQLRTEGANVSAGGVPLEFFHFSGYDPRTPAMLSKYTRLFRNFDDPVLTSLTRQYAAALYRHGFARLIGMRYGYDFDPHGRRVSQAVRSHYAATYLVSDGDPFCDLQRLEGETAAVPTALEHTPSRRPLRHQIASLWRDLARVRALPNRAGPAVVGGYVSLLLRRPTIARAAARAARSRAPCSADLGLMLGQLFEEHGLHTDAIDHYATALHIDHASHRAVRQLASLGALDRAHEVLRAGWPDVAPATSSTSGGPMAILSIATGAQLAGARVLYDGARHHYPEARLILVLADDACCDAMPADVSVLRAEDLGVRALASMRDRYRADELAAAIKPFALRHLLAVEKFEIAAFFAPEVMIVARSPMLDDLKGTASVLLTPRRLTPASGADPISDLDLLRTGSFDSGFIGVRRDVEALAFLDWWSRHLEFDCVDRPDEGCYRDRKVLDLAPAYFDNVSIGRSPGANVGHWNIAERSLAVDIGEAPVAGSSRLEFFNFAGLDLASAHGLPAQIPAVDSTALRALMRHYVRQLAVHRDAQACDTPRVFDATAETSV